MRRTIVIGDLHGCVEEFDELLRQVEYRQGRDRLVLCGDLIDRGPDGVGCIRRAQEVGAESVLGNHDDGHIQWRAYVDKCKAKGKIPTRNFAEDKRLENEKLSEKDLSWFRSLPFYLPLGNNFVVAHAGAQPSVTVPDEDPGILMHMRFVDRDTGKYASLDKGDFAAPPNSVFWTKMWRGPESIIFGHAVHEHPTVVVNEVKDPPMELFREGWPQGSVYTIAVDTGCCFGGSLSCVISEDDFLTWHFSSVKAKYTYRKIPGGLVSV